MYIRNMEKRVYLKVGNALTPGREAHGNLSVYTPPLISFLYQTLRKGGETDSSTKPSFHLLSPPQGESGDSGWDLSLSVPPHLPKTEEKEFLCLYFISALTPIRSHLIKVFYRFGDVGKLINRHSLLQSAPNPH